jgi:hypothetical protein
MSSGLAAVALDGAGGTGATGDLTSSMATSLGIYTYILDEMQIAGTAIPIKKIRVSQLDFESRYNVELFLD